MTTPLHTAGPWYDSSTGDKRSDGYIRRVGDTLPGTTAIAQVLGRGPSSEQRANRRLITAAPRMSAALKRAAHVLAELPPLSQDPNLIALRQQIVEVIKESTPEHYGLPT